MMGTTQTMKNFRVEDITFKNARKQSEVEKELGIEEYESAEVEVPKSLTPEQVVKYFENIIKSTDDIQVKRVYSLAITWIKSLQETKQQLQQYKIREMRKSEDETTPDDLQTDEVLEV